MRRSATRLDYQFQVHLRDVLPHTLRLNEEQRPFVWRGSALDSGVFSAVACKLVLGIEVDGSRYHEGDPVQRLRPGPTPGPTSSCPNMHDSRPASQRRARPRAAHAHGD